MKSGIIVIAPLEPPVREEILALQLRFDPKLASLQEPHVTIVGSSGMGPISTKTPLDELEVILRPIAAATAPMSLALGAPTRFMQSNVVAFGLDPHGPLRALHDRIRAAGLLAESPRFTFTPHVTINFFPEPTDAALREMLAVRITQPIVLRRIQCHETLDVTRTRLLLELELTGPGAR